MPNKQSAIQLSRIVSKPAKYQQPQAQVFHHKKKNTQCTPCAYQPSAIGISRIVAQAQNFKSLNHEFSIQKKTDSVHHACLRILNQQKILTVSNK